MAPRGREGLGGCRGPEEDDARVEGRVPLVVARVVRAPVRALSLVRGYFSLVVGYVKAVGRTHHVGVGRWGAERDSSEIRARFERDSKATRGENG